MALDAVVNFGANTTQLEAGAKRAQGIVSRLSSSVSGLAAGFAGAFAASQVIDFAKGAVDASIELEGLRNTLTFVMGSTVAASAEMERLRESAKLPGLDFANAVKGSANLQLIGFSADEARKFLEDLGNVAAIAGLNEADFSNIIDALTDIANAGEISDEKIDRLNERTGLFSLALKKAFGAATAQGIRDAGVSVDEFFQGLGQALSELERAPDSLATTMKNAQDEIKALKAEIGESLTPVVQSLFGSISEGIKFVMPLLNDMRAVFGQITEQVSLMLQGYSYREAVDSIAKFKVINAEVARQEKEKAEAARIQAEERRKAEEAVAKSQVASGKSAVTNRVDYQHERDIIKAQEQLAADQAQFAYEQLSVREKYLATEREIARLNKVINDELNAGVVDQERILKIQSEEIKLRSRLLELGREFTREVVEREKKAQEREAEKARVTLARSLFEAETRILELQNSGSRAARRQADEMQRQIDIAQLQKRLMDEQNLSAEQALQLAERRINAEERGERRAAGRRIQGYTRKQREESPFANPFRGLDSFARGQSAFDRLQQTKSRFQQLQESASPFAALRGRGGAIAAKAAENNRESKLPPKDPVQELLSKLVANTDIVAKAVQ